MTAAYRLTFPQRGKLSPQSAASLLDISFREKHFFFLVPKEAEPLRLGAPDEILTERQLYFFYLPLGRSLCLEDTEG